MSETPDDPFTPPSYGTPMPPPIYRPPSFALPPQYYAGPDDPLVSSDMSGWWNRSLRLLRAAWRPLLLVHLISVPPFEILTAWAQTTALDDIRNDPDHVTGSEVRTFLLRLGLAIVIGILLSVVVSLTAQRILVQVATGRPASIGAALLAGLRRTPALIGWGFPVVLMVLAGLLFCVLPGLYLGAVFTVLPAIVLLERGNAIARSFRLVHADIGAALGRIVVYYGVSFLFVTVEGLLSRAVTAFGTSLAVTVVSTAVGTVFGLAAAVAVSPMVLTAYADMRARREPFATAYLAAPTSSDSAVGDR